MRKTETTKWECPCCGAGELETHSPECPYFGMESVGVLEGEYESSTTNMTNSTDWLAGYHQALEDAATECERHAKFCKDEAHKGGDFHHLITRHHEATYNAQTIRGMKEKGL